MPETLQFIRQLSRHVKGPISEGAGIEQSEMTGGVSRGVNPLRFAALSSSPEGGAFRHLAVSRAKPPPFGGGGIAVGDDGEGSSRKV